MRKTDKLNDAQLRKVVKLASSEARKPNRDSEQFVNRLIDEYPALKRPDQQKRIVDRLEAIDARERATNAFVSYVLKRAD